MQTDSNTDASPRLPIDSFVVSLPEGWSEIPIGAGQLDELIGGSSPADLADRRKLLLLRRLVGQLRAGGLVLAAVSHEEIEVGYYLTALCWMMTRRAADLDVEVIEFAHLQQAVEPDPDPPARRLRRPEVVDISAGPAIRDLSVTSIGSTDGDVELLESRYHFLIGEGEGMAVLGFATINIELADELSSLFDLVAASVEFTTA